MFGPGSFARWIYSFHAIGDLPGGDGKASGMNVLRDNIIRHTRSYVRFEETVINSFGETGNAGRGWPTFWFIISNKLRNCGLIACSKVHWFSFISVVMYIMKYIFKNLNHVNWFEKFIESIHLLASAVSERTLWKSWIVYHPYSSPFSAYSFWSNLPFPQISTVQYCIEPTFQHKLCHLKEYANSNPS